MGVFLLFFPRRATNITVSGFGPCYNIANGNIADKGEITALLMELLTSTRQTPYHSRRQK